MDRAASPALRRRTQESRSTFAERFPLSAIVIRGTTQTLKGARAGFSRASRVPGARLQVATRQHRVRLGRRIPARPASAFSSGQRFPIFPISYTASMLPLAPFQPLEAAAAHAVRGKNVPDKRLRRGLGSDSGGGALRSGLGRGSAPGRAGPAPARTRYSRTGPVHDHQGRRARRPLEQCRRSSSAARWSRCPGPPRQARGRGAVNNLSLCTERPSRSPAGTAVVACCRTGAVTAVRGVARRLAGCAGGVAAARMPEGARSTRGPVASGPQSSLPTPAGDLHPPTAPMPGAPYRGGGPALPLLPLDSFHAGVGMPTS